MMRFRRISPCPKCGGGKVKAKWELDGVIGGYRFYLVLFRCTVCGFAFEGVARLPETRIACNAT